MRSSRLDWIGLCALALFSTPAAADDLNTLYNTGVDASGNALPSQVVDPHYSLIVSPDGAYPGPAAYTTDPIPSPPWVANSATSRWITPRPDGSGVVDRLAAREAGLKPFRWEVRTRRPQHGAPYIFIAGNGRDDGAALRYSTERQSITFSDARYGPHFAFGIIQDCWPGFVPTRPPTALAVCSPAADATARGAAQRRLVHDGAHGLRVLLLPGRHGYRGVPAVLCECRR